MSLFNKTPLEQKEANWKKATKKRSGMESAYNDAKGNPKKRKKLKTKVDVAKTNEKIAEKEFDHELKNSPRTPSKKK